MLLVTVEVGLIQLVQGTEQTFQLVFQGKQLV